VKYITIFGSARLDASSEHYQKAYKIAKALAATGYGVITGGGGGIMEAANRGAFEARGDSIGINVILPNEQQLNSYCTKSQTLNSLSERKNALIKDSFAFIIFPGGFGTLDEAFEVITLAQARLRDHKVIFVQRDFWEPLFNFLDNLVNLDLVNKNSYYSADNIDEIMDILLL
jgi:uncharacterized protein (TIGR00730 family)